MENTRFGDKIIQREDSSEPWVDVPMDDQVEAGVAVGIAETLKKRNTENPPRLGLTITRSRQNEGIAAKLGITADQLAERLARPNDNQGTVTRVPEGEFDGLMDELGLSPDEARARFKGTHWE